MQLLNHLPDITIKPGFINHWHLSSQSGLALLINEISNQFNGPILILCNQSSEVQRLEKEIKIFQNETDRPLLVFPDWETLPYDYFSAHHSIISERIHCLYHLSEIKTGIVVTTLSSAMTRLSPQSFIKQNSFVIHNGQTLHLTEARRHFESIGYHCVEKVLAHGEFAIRGALLDIFPMGAHWPYRVDFFDNEIDSIRQFDPETQLSKDKIDHVNLLPAHEFPTDSDAIHRFRQQFRESFDVNLKDCTLYEDVSKGFLPAGIEYYLPLFNETTQPFLDYLSSETLIITLDNTLDALETHWQRLEERYEDRRWDRTRPLLSPQQICVSPSDTLNTVKRFSRINISNESQKSSVALDIQPVVSAAIQHQSKDPLETLKTFIQQDHRPVIICAESAGRRESLLELFQNHHLKVKQIDHWQQGIQQPQTTDVQVYLTITPLEQGFETTNCRFVAESDLFGQQVMQRRRRGKRQHEDIDQVIHNMAELKENDPIVHIEHGVGRYRGLQCLQIDKHPAEFLTLEYAGGDKLYIPVQDLHLIHRYSGNESAPWHKLGHEQWQKARKKAAEKVRDVAAELLELYAQRAAKKGFQYNTALTEMRQFAAQFPFELTDDQVTAIQAITADMSSNTPMDRLVCGDVGFGKTEVAMRAAFIAVQNEKQVAILVPTTLLAQQHYDSFNDRFADWPVKIEMISRFTGTAKNKITLASIQEGQTDIVIGTHKLIQGNIHFKNLGLVIIDEEHRFGVNQKEQLKKLCAEVDLLTLTATPIPRTLNMSLSGMRDLSIIVTPPAKRLAIKTFVREYNKPLLKEAILRETLRGGQVYYLHNSVESIERCAQDLRELMPEISIEVAHGQMRERDLERVMQNFYHQRFQVLVCTTIIETGIDVPNANTIIMERADKLGLAQLHQLRGRVGRSHHQAYAYLLTVGQKAMTKDAKKRLEAISSLEDLGAGFSLATHDMEIRGTGELLGDDQSGHMETIGFSLYMEMLEKAVKSLQSDNEADSRLQALESIHIDLKIPALIPEDYIHDVHTRLIFYKRIANAKHHDTLRELQVELIDRFGLLPQNLKHLFKITELKLKLSTLGIIKVQASDKSMLLEMSESTCINPAIVIKLIQTSPEIYRLENNSRLRIIEELDTPEAKWLLLDNIIELFQK